MESGVRKLLDRKNEIDKQIAILDVQVQHLSREREGINRSLAIMGVRPVDDEDHAEKDTLREREYKSERPFAKMSLPAACLKVFRDHDTDWLTRAQVEYLVKCGGYGFSTSDTKNSIAVTLQRLAAVSDSRLQAKRIRGSTGNKYRYKPKT